MRINDKKCCRRVDFSLQRTCFGFALVTQGEFLTNWESKQDFKIKYIYFLPFLRHAGTFSFYRNLKKLEDLTSIKVEGESAPVAAIFVSVERKKDNSLKVIAKPYAP